jgi:hypothetical protein
VVLAVLTLTQAPRAEAVGSELLPNTSFEQGANTTVAAGVDQPLLPVGWVPEGAAALFDHSPHERHHGRYSAAISGPASVKRRTCAPAPVGCHDNTPLNEAKAAADGPGVSVTPAWRPVNPVAVSAGTAYVVSGWFTWQLASAGDGGGLVKVRWLDGNGVGIRTDTAVLRVAAGDYQPWTFFSAGVVAPAGAAKAVPLFAALDDAFITKISYDEVSFRAA